jgi:hypothetical protein
MAHILFEPSPRGRRRGWLIGLAVSIFFLLLLTRWAASLALEYAWWKELGQVETWIGLFTYAYAPLTAATLLAFLILWFTHWRALHFAGLDRKSHRLYLPDVARTLVPGLGACIRHSR